MAEEKEVLYIRRRPTKLSEVIGQDGVIDTLRGFGKRKMVPRCMLFLGDSGCGKTTLARILAGLLKCGPHDLVEVNAASNNGVDMVRALQKRCRLAPISGPVRVWIIDECHQLTGAAQNAFLKLLEDTPKNVYFFLATTDPQKLLKTVRSRATELKLAPVGGKVLEDYVTTIAQSEGWDITEDVAEAIAEAADGGVRKALVLLDQISTIADEEDQLAAVTSADTKAVSFELCKLLLKPKTSWPDIAKVLKTVTDEPESMRWMVLGYANAILTKSANSRAATLIDAFQYPFHDTKKAGLTLACWRVHESG